MADEYTREWRFRAWDPVSKKMYSPEALEEPETEEGAPKTIFGKLYDGELKILDMKQDPPIEFLPMQGTDWFDNQQYEVYEGDILELDDKYCQVIWDTETAGYMLLYNDGSVEQGGEYLSDALKIVGNIFENGDAKPEDRKRPLRFRAWDPDAKIMYLPDELKDPEEDFSFSIYAYLTFGVLYIYDFKNDPPMELIPMQDTGWVDMDGAPIFEGDVVRIGEGENEEIAQIIWSAEIGQFIFMTNEGTLVPGAGSIAIQTKIVGDIYQNPTLVPQI